MDEEMPIFIDIEASGFGEGSYPIEIGVVLPRGDTFCTLIRPYDDWRHWDAQAEHLHGIRRDLLIANGKEPRVVADMLNRRLDGATVYTDAWGNDSVWLALLYDRAGLRQRFRLETVASILSEHQLMLWHEAKARVMRELKITRHRASSDALLLQETWLRVRDMARARVGLGLA